jgi:hypothetical protein
MKVAWLAAVTAGKLDGYLVETMDVSKADCSVSHLVVDSGEHLDEKSAA